MTKTVLHEEDTHDSADKQLSLIMDYVVREDSDKFWFKAEINKVYLSDDGIKLQLLLPWGNTARWSYDNFGSKFEKVLDAYDLSVSKYKLLEGQPIYVTIKKKELESNDGNIEAIHSLYYEAITHPRYSRKRLLLAYLLQNIQHIIVAIVLYAVMLNILALVFNIVAPVILGIFTLLLFLIYSDSSYPR